MSKLRTTAFWIGAGIFSFFLVVMLSESLPPLFSNIQRVLLVGTGLIVIIIILLDRLFEHIG